MQTEIAQATDEDLREIPFVGRQEELKKLLDHYEGVANGDSSLILVEALSGGGKSRLLNEFIDRLQQQETQPLILRGQGQNNQIKQPFLMFSQIIKCLLENGASDLLHTLRNEIFTSSDIEALTTALPELRNFYSVFLEHDDPDDAFGEQRAINALAKLMNSLGRYHRPVILLLDDSQWADDLTLKVLNQWMRGLSWEHSQPLLVVVAFRSELRERVLRMLQRGDKIHLILRPLDSDQMQLFIKAVAPRLSANQSVTVLNSAQGNPFLATSAIRSIIETTDTKSESIVATVQDDINFIQRRFQFLEERHLRTLSYAAIIGKRFSKELLACSLDKSIAEVLDTLKLANKRCFLTKPDEQYEFFHDKVREGLEERLSFDERRKIHRDVANAISKMSPDEIFAIAYHYDEAQEYQLAYPFAIRAAYQATARHALEAAEVQFKIAERGLDTSDKSAIYSVLEGLGVTLMNRGKYSEAEVYLLKAADLARNEEVAAYLNLRIGELRVRQGDFKRSILAIEEGLRRLGEPDQAKFISRLLGLPFYILVHAIRYYLPESIRRYLTKRDISSRERLILQLHNRLAYAYWFNYGSYRSALPHYRSLFISEGYKPTAELLHAYTGHALLFSVFGFYNISLAYCKLAKKLQAKVGNQWTNGQYQNFYGIIECGVSHFRNSIELCSEASGELETVGDHWEANVAQSTILYSLYRLGNLKEVCKKIESAFNRAKEIGDLVNETLTLYIWSMASLGNAPEEEISRCISGAVGNDFQAHIECLLARAFNRIYKANYEEALSQVEEASSLFKGRIFTLSYIQSTFPLLALCYRLTLAAKRKNGEQIQDSYYKKLKRNWKRAVRKALLYSYIYPNHRPFVFREAALLALSNGANKKAAYYLNKSLITARNQDAKYEEALSHLAVEISRRQFDLGTINSNRELALDLLDKCNVSEKEALKLLQVN